MSSRNANRQARDVGKVEILVPEGDAAFVKRMRQSIQIARDGGIAHSMLANSPLANSLTIEFAAVERLCDIAERGLTTRRRA